MHHLQIDPKIGWMATGAGRTGETDGRFAVGRQVAKQSAVGIIGNRVTSEPSGRIRLEMGELSMRTGGKEAATQAMHQTSHRKIRAGGPVFSR